MVITFRGENAKDAAESRIILHTRIIVVFFLGLRRLCSLLKATLATEGVYFGDVKGNLVEKIDSHCIY